MTSSLRPLAALALAVFSAVYIVVATGCAEGVNTGTLEPPKSSTAEEKRGDELLAQKSWQGAVIEYDNALAAGAAPAVVGWKKGNAFFMAKMWPEALDSFLFAASAEEKMPLAWQGAGLAAFELGRLDEASGHFEKAIQSAPKDWISHAFLAGIHFVKGNVAKAKTHNQAVFDLSGDNKKQADEVIKMAYRKAQVIKNKAAEPNDPMTPKPQTAKTPSAQAKTAQPPVQAPAPQPAQVVSAPAPAPVVSAPTPQPAPAPKKEPVKEIVIDDGKSPLDMTGEVAKAVAPVSPVDPASTAAPAASTAAAAAPVVQPSPKVEPAAPAASPEKTVAKDAAADEAKRRAEALAAEKKAKLEKQKAETPKPEPQTAVEGVWSVQESAWPSKAAAQRRVDELEKKGVGAHVATIDQGAKGIAFKVLIGGVREEEKARRIREELVSRFGLSPSLEVVKLRAAGK